MDPMAWAGIGQTVLGGLGLFQQGSQARAQAGYLNEMKKVLRMQRGSIGKITDLADKYDPWAETRQSVDYASQVTGDTLTKNLGALNQQFRNAGGSPSGDTAFRVNAQGMTNRITDPLRQFAAERAAGDYTRKMQAFQMALGAPAGQLASQYGQMAQMSAPNYGPSLGLIAGGINMFGQQGRGNDQQNQAEMASGKQTQMRQGDQYGGQAGGIGMNNIT